MLLPFLPPGTAAQVRVEGVVVTDAPAGPAEGAAVLLDGEQRAVTDPDGTFWFEAPPGRYRLEIRLVGYGAAAAQLELVAGDDPQIRVQLRRLSSELDTVVVEGEGPRYTPRLAGFYDRRKTWPSGQYITWEDIERTGVPRLSDFFRTLRSIDLECTNKFCTGYLLRPSTSRVLPSFSQAPRRSSSGGSDVFAKQRDECYAQYYLDGVQYYVGEEGIDGLPLDGIAAIEVYVGASQVPIEFSGRNARCGVVVMWTKDGSEQRERER